MKDCDTDQPLLTRSSCLHGDDRTASKPHGGLSIEIGCTSIIDRPARNEPNASVSCGHGNHEPQGDLNAASLAQFGSLVSDASRVNMLLGLLDGSATTTRELAAKAGVTPQTASGHLAKFAAAGLIRVEREGRTRHHRFASAEIEQLPDLLCSATSAMQQHALDPARGGRRDALS